MSALNFPNTGLYAGYQYTGDNGVLYIYDGVKWVGHAPTLAPGTSSLVNGTNVVQLTGDGTLVLPIPSNANPGTGAIGFLGTWIKNTDQGGIYLSPQDANVWIQLPSSTDSPTTPLELTNRGLGGVTVDSGIGNTVIKNYNSATNLDNVWTFDSNGEFTLPTGGRLGFAGKGWTGLDGGNGQPVSLTSLYPSGMYSGCVTITPGNGINISTYGDGTGQTGSWSFNNNGTTQLPNGITQASTGTVLCAAGADTVVYTGTAQYQMTFKLLLKVEGIEGSNSTEDTQSTEMIVAKGSRANAVVASVYGVVHTSVLPLATFTAQWNAVTGLVEITCRPTSLTNSVTVIAFATEISTSH